MNSLLRLPSLFDVQHSTINNDNNINNKNNKLLLNFENNHHQTTFYVFCLNVFINKYSLKGSESGGHWNGFLTFQRQKLKMKFSLQLFDKQMKQISGYKLLWEFIWWKLSKFSKYFTRQGKLNIQVQGTVTIHSCRYVPSRTNRQTVVYIVMQANNLRHQSTQMKKKKL